MLIWRVPCICVKFNINVSSFVYCYLMWNLSFDAMADYLFTDRYLKVTVSACDMSWKWSSMKHRLENIEVRNSEPELEIPGCSEYSSFCSEFQTSLFSHLQTWHLTLAKIYLFNNGYTRRHCLGTELTFIDGGVKCNLFNPTANVLAFLTTVKLLVLCSWQHPAELTRNLQFHSPKRDGVIICVIISLAPGARALHF